MKPNEVSLGEICDFIRGVTFPAGEAKRAPFSDSIACLTTSGVQADVAWESRRYIPKARVVNSERLLRPGDILISTANSKELVGKSCCVRNVPFACTFGAFVTTARANKKVLPAFLSYWMTTAAFQNWCFRNSSNTTNISNIRVSELEELRLHLPELSEQKRIAAILERADRFRRLRRYSLELSEDFLSVAYHRLFGDPRANPKNIPVAELGKYIAFLTSGSRGWAEHYVKSGARFIRSLDVQMNRIPNDNAVFVDAPPGAEAKRTSVMAGDVLLTVTGSRIGRVSPVPASLEGAFVSQHVAIIRLASGLLPRFLSMFLSLETGGQLEIRRFQYGQTKPGLALNQIGKFRIQVPPLERQREFMALADRYESLRAIQTESLRQAEHLFQTLLHRAFTSGL